VLYLFIGTRRSTDRAVNLLFGSFAMIYAFAIITARSAFSADSISDYVGWIRASTLFAAIGFPLLIWFVAAYTRVRPRRLLSVMTAGFAVIAIASVFLPDLVVDVSSGVNSVTLPWGETVLMLQQDDAALLPLLLLALLASIVYIVAAAIRQFRRGERSEAVFLAVGIGWFIFTIVEESLVEVGAIDFVVLSDFGFLGFVLAMGLQLTNRTIETERELLDYRANLLAMVDERSAELESAQEQLLVQAKEQATTVERNRLARELHDVVTQLLFSINLVAGSLPQLWRADPVMAERSTNELQRLTRGALAEMRTLLRELRPHAIEETDLVLLITHLSDGLSARQDIPAHLHLELSGVLPVNVHVALYRIAQEAMNNIAKHANASSVTVNLAGTDSRAELVVIDDGYGFDQPESMKEGMGLGIMRERADEISADLSIVSEQDQGTTVTAIWQAEPTEDDQ
jgi:signal transduction histidine kinase